MGIHAVLDLGEERGYDMLYEVVAHAVETEDVGTFGEQYSPSVVAAVGKVLALVRREIAG